jgi:hypothetical protein
MREKEAILWLEALRKGGDDEKFESDIFVSNSCESCWSGKAK